MVRYLSREPATTGVDGLDAVALALLLNKIPLILSAVQDLRALLTERRKDFFTVEEFAGLVGRSPYTVRTWVKAGLVKATRVSGTGPRGRLLIPRDQLRTLLESGLAAGVPDASLDPGGA